jgi:hypothetical protein
VPRTNWHLEDVTVDQSDPFTTPPAQRIDLSDPTVLRAKLTALLTLEGKLEERGITCAIRDRPNSCCSGCPLRGTSRVQHIRSLCRVGVEQEQTLMAILADDA